MSVTFVSPDTVATRHGTIPSLDGLRAISILLVLAAHFINVQFPGGLGVYIFFVISGFLITRLLVAEHNEIGTISLSLFYMRRIIRLYPVIIVFTLFIISMHMLLGRPYNLIEPAAGLAYFANYLYSYFAFNNIAAQMPFAVFWSLSVEEHFYILFPPLFVLLHGRPKMLLWVLAGLCITCLGLRLGVALLHPEYLNTILFYVETQYRMDSIAYGVILALLCETVWGQRCIHHVANPAAALAAFAVVLACLLVRNALFRETLRYTMLGCAIDVMLAAVLFSHNLTLVQRILNTGVLIWIGRLSYSIYIWHEGITSFLPTDGWPRWLAATAKLALTISVAATSYYVVEQPSLRLRQYLPIRASHARCSGSHTPSHIT